MRPYTIMPVVLRSFFIGDCRGYLACELDQLLHLLRSGSMPSHLFHHFLHALALHAAHHLLHHGHGVEPFRRWRRYFQGFADAGLVIRGERHG